MKKCFFGGGALKIYIYFFISRGIPTYENVYILEKCTLPYFQKFPALFRDMFGIVRGI